MSPPKKERCKRGHLLTEETVYTRSDGTRSCRECNTERNRKHRQQRREREIEEAALPSVPAVLAKLDAKDERNAELEEGLRAIERWLSGRLDGRDRQTLGSYIGDLLGDERS